ncbi:MAG: hypothetical protein U0232_12265 [Thermomicrobiales bacterium]
MQVARQVSGLARCRAIPILLPSPRPDRPTARLRRMPMTAARYVAAIVRTVRR